jgi:hypothetical protein
MIAAVVTLHNQREINQFVPYHSLKGKTVQFYTDLTIAAAMTEETLRPVRSGDRPIGSPVTIGLI